MQQGRIVRAPRFLLTQLDIMDEPNIHAAWKQIKGHMRRFVCKSSVNQLATGQYMRRMGFWPSDKCPCCLHDNETSIHVLQCPSNHENLKESLGEFHIIMKQLDTSPAILSAVKYLIQKGTLLCTDSVPPQSPKVLDLINAQLQLPLDEFLQGRIVKAWAILQREHYHTICAPWSEDKWAAAFVTNLWNIYFSSWTHRK